MDKKNKSSGIKRLLMNKTAKESFWAVLVFGVALSILFLVSYVLGAGDAGTTGAGNTFAVSDDVSTLINVSINNTKNGVYNITNVTFLLTTAAQYVLNFTHNTNSTADFFNYNNRTIEFQVNITNNTVGTIAFNVTGVVPGDYNITVLMVNHTVNASDINLFANNISVHVNDTFTVEPNGTGSPLDFSNATFLIPINFTLGGNETGVDVNVSISNASIVLQSNTTFAFSGSDFLMNWSAENLTSSTLPDGTYFINISRANSTTLDDNLGKQSIQVILDRTGPTVTLTNSSSDTTKTTIVGDIAISDVTAGAVNSSVCNVDNTEATITGTGASQTLTHNGLSCGTKVTYIVTCQDIVGNSGSSAATILSTQECSSGDGGGSSGGGGGGGGSGSGGGNQESNVEWVTTYPHDAQELSQMSEGVTQELAALKRMSVLLNAQTHFVGVVEVRTTSATIEVSSTPQQVDLSVGQSERFDVDGDGEDYDMRVTLNSIVDGVVGITALAISEPVISQSPGEPGEQQPPTTQQAPETAGGKSIWWLWFIVLAGIVIAVVYFIRRQQSK